MQFQSLTENERKDFEREQKRLSKLYLEQTEPMSDWEHRFRQAVINEQVALDNIKSISGSEPEDRVRLQIELDKLAHALSVQGRFDEALEINCDYDLTRRISAIKVAVLCNDSDRCSCPDTPHVGKNNKVEFLPVHYIQDYVFSPKHLRFMPLVACNSCGHLNVTNQLSDSLSALESSRKK
jgi:hypothetical protein